MLRVVVVGEIVWKAKSILFSALLRRVVFKLLHFIIMAQNFFDTLFIVYVTFCFTLCRNEESTPFHNGTQLSCTN